MRRTLATLLATLAIAAIGAVPAAAPALAGVTAPPVGGASAQSAPSDVGEWVARVVYRAVAHTEPSGAAPALGLISPVSRWGTPTDLLVLDARRDASGREWLRLLLDERPNGSAVWVDADDTVLYRDRWRIAVSRVQRRVAVYRDGHLSRAFAAVVGKPSTPTPSGLFAIAAKLRQPDPREFEGSWVLPLTAHSNVLRRFAGGDGQVALHGRGGTSLLDPLGSARSHGCVRLANRAIAWIAAHVPVGTAVRVS